jgi:hypothetical protein
MVRRYSKEMEGIMSNKHKESKCPWCGRELVIVEKAIYRDSPWLGEWEGDTEYECTCTYECDSPCKGGCGCKACHRSYMHFLDVE